MVQRKAEGYTTWPVYDTVLYDAYGMASGDFWTFGGFSPHHNPLGFGGQFGYYTNFETGLLCLTHRYYDPATGRFVNRDPNATDAQYALNGNNGGEQWRPDVANARPELGLRGMADGETALGSQVGSVSNQPSLHSIA